MKFAIRICSAALVIASAASMPALADALEDGIAAYHNKDYAKAVECANQSIALHPRPTSWVYKRKAEGHWGLGQFKEALDALRTAWTNNPKDLSTLTWICPTLIARCPNEEIKTEILKLADDAVAKDPAARSYRAVIAMHLGQWDKAREDMAELMKAGSANYSSYYQLAMLYLADKNPEQYRTTSRDMLAKFAESKIAEELIFTVWAAALAPQALDDYGPAIALAQHGVELNKDNPDPATRDWLPGDSAALAIGQGDLLVTPLKEAVGYATFANGGTRFAPRLAEKILTPGGETILRDLPVQEVANVEVPPEVRAPIMDGLINVVKGIGTAAPAFSGYSGIEVAGKTGTIEVLGKQDTSAFAAILNPNPVTPDDPQYVIMVFVEQGGNGGSVAAPISRRIIEALNGNLTPPNVRLVAPKGD